MEGVERAFLVVIAFVCIAGSAIFVMHGVALRQEQSSVAAAAASAAPTTAPIPTQKPNTASTPSKQDTLTPECEAKTKQNEKLAQYGVREEIRKQLPVEYSKSIKEATTQGFCKPELAVQQTWPGCDSKKCPLGVTVFPKGTKLSPGVVQCSSGKSGFVVACRQKDQEPKEGDGNVPPPERKPTQASGDIGNDLQKTDAGQQGGGQGGSPSGGGGGSQSPTNEAAQQAFNEPPLPEQRSDALIARDREISESLQNTQNEIDSVEERLDAYYDREGARGTDEESTLLRQRENLSRTREELLAERAELAPYVRSEASERIQEIGSPQTMSEYAEQQNLRRQVSELDQLVSQGEGYGRQSTQEMAGFPYRDPYGTNPGTLQQVESQYVGASYYSCLQSQGSTCYGGDGRRVSENRLRDGDIAITPQLRRSIGLAHNEIAEVLLEGPNGNRAWATVRDEIGFGNETVPSYAPGAGQRVHIDYFREPNRQTSSLMDTLGLGRSSGLQGNVRVVLVRRY